MKPSVIVYGPPGCGKTRNHRRFLAYFDLEEVRPRWKPTETLRTFGTLYLTDWEPQELDGWFNGIELVSFAALKARGLAS